MKVNIAKGCTEVRLSTHGLTGLASKVACKAIGLFGGIVEAEDRIELASFGIKFVRVVEAKRPTDKWVVILRTVQIGELMGKPEIWLELWIRRLEGVDPKDVDETWVKEAIDATGR